VGGLPLVQNEGQESGTTPVRELRLSYATGAPPATIPDMARDARPPERTSPRLSGLVPDSPALIAGNEGPVPIGRSSGRMGLSISSPIPNNPR
jgi:hypothetical protein